MSKLYYYYQKIGGTEAWTPCQAETEFHEIKPTFITVLALDTLLEDTPSREVVEAVKYQGPFYLDLDAPDIADSIEAGKQILEKLISAGLKDVDLEIYLSGKKGLHILVHQDAFIHKSVPLVRLPAIYKEMAFKMAVDTVDFRVYTARKGRMWRTCYNIRENGNYRVPVTPDELRALTPEQYSELCKAPRSVAAPQPRFRPEFALIFDAAQQKVNSIKRKKHKPVTAQELRKVLPEVQQILKGEGLAEVGFNKIAIQLAVYAREAQWSEDTLVGYARQLIDSHQSDGRYNTPNKREQHLRDMCAYVEDNPGYDYQASYLRSVIAKDIVVSSAVGADDSGNFVPDEEEFTLSSGVFVRGGRYIVPKGEDGDTEISNFTFRESNILVDPADGKIVAIRATVGKDTNIVLSPSNFTSSTSLQNVVSGYGKSFTGSDVHARGIYQIMLKEVSRTSYIVDSEGLNYIKLPAHPDPEVASHPFLAWADRYQVVMPAWVRERDVKLEFLGYPDERGVIQTDLTAAPSLKEYLSDEENKLAMANCIRWLMKASHPETMAKLIGWMSASHWKPLFQEHHGKFPLLHVFGPAGLGKCLGRDTPVLMFDGTKKMVQDIVAGDKLLGPDGTVRNVLNTTTGRERLYKVTPVKGDAYIVNESHILSLKKSDKNSGKLRMSDGTFIAQDADIVNVNVKVVHDTEDRYSSKLKGWRPDGLEFPTEKLALPVDPYWLGAWLGDGRANDTAIYKPKCNMTRWVQEYAASLGLTVSVYDADRCPGWAIVSSYGNNPVRQFLQSADLINNKHIPHNYLTASRADRLKLLAGLVDSDGALSDGNIDWISKSKQLAEQVVFLSRSLGLAAYVKQCQKSIRSLGFVGTYYRVTISGDCSIIPTLDKVSPKRKQVKRVTVTGITIEALDVGDYYGFQIDGDHLFLLGDFTVTHNTELTQSLLRMFYYREDPKTTTPASTPFALLTMIGGSSSIPVMLDEWKPSRMNPDIVEKYRAILRDAYNGKETQRGGGSRGKDAYNSLAKVSLDAPLVFISEACESETAILERSVVLTFRRPGAREQGTTLGYFRRFQSNLTPLSVIGKAFAASALKDNSEQGYVDSFTRMLDWAYDHFMLQPGDDVKLKEGKLTQEDMTRKMNNSAPRPIYNATVALFGLVQLRNLLRESLGDLYDAELNTGFKDLMGYVYAGLNVGMSMRPEYIKVLITMSDMSKTTEKGSAEHVLTDGVDYNLSELGGKPVLILATRFAYNKYRAYMRMVNQLPLYPNEASFEAGIKEIPQYIKAGTGTNGLLTETAVLDLDALIAAGVPMFFGRTVALNP